MHAYIFEAVMLVCFGVSWPVSIAKSLRTRFVRGKSPLFMTLVAIGYASGVVHKLLNPPATAGGLARHVIWLYALNFAMVLADLILYYRFRHHAEELMVNGKP
jgi:hypothetical protein